MQNDLRPKVGVGVLVLKDGQVLLGKRKGSHGDGEYASPGGHLEYGETFEACAAREVLEETGLKITNIRFQRVASILSYAPKHYVDIGVIADWESGQASVLEPEKCEGWAWYNIDALPSPIFEATMISIESIKTGKTYFSL